MSTKKRTTSRHAVKTGAAVLGATLAFGISAAGAAAPGTSKGPSTSVDPYVIPVDATNTQIMSLLTVDDNGATGQTNTTGYPMAGIPDGLGIYKNGNNAVLLSNHELGNAQGVARGPLTTGAFVSTWTLDGTKAVTAGANLITSVDFASTTPSTFNRLCSADLAQAAQLYNTASGNGFNGRLFMNGEEAGLEGRAVATDPATGEAWVLNALGRTSWENSLAAYTPTSDTQLVIGMNDSSGAGQNANLVYVGTKTNTGSAVAKAGLTNGLLYTIKLTGGVTTDASFRTTYGLNSPQPFTLAQITGATGSALQADSVLKGGFQADRSEDGAWDPAHPNDFYFVTTGSTTAANGRGGLWRMRWNDVTQPALGGTLTLLVTHPTSHSATDDSTNQQGFYMPDNMTIDGHGHILLQEDPGSDNYLARVFAYDIATNQLKPIATFDPALFGAGNPGFLTNDEESSGIIDTEAIYGAGTFVMDAQVHTGSGLSNTTRDVERGQYMLMTVDFSKVFPTAEPVVSEAPYAALLAGGAIVILGAGTVVLRRRQAI